MFTAACSPGNYLNVSDNRCYVCDYGSYQPDKWQIQCLTCDVNFTTETTASTNRSDCKCKFFLNSKTFCQSQIMTDGSK